MNENEDKPDQAEVLRNEAIDMYLQGQNITKICRQLGRSRPWFYRTLKRYRQAGRVGLQSQSRAPQRVHNRTKPKVEQTIVRIRKTIMAGQDPELRYANMGADSLAFELKRLQIEPPHRATINRILKRYDLVQPRQDKNEPAQLPADYPWPQSDQVNAVQQLDFVSRRIGGSGERFYGSHLLDIARRWPYLRIITTKSTQQVCQFLVSAWQEIGLPTALQIDNDIVWNGGGRGQRVLGRVVRLCLAVGVQVIYIPPYTPRANGIIESFNHLWQANFWGRTQFKDIDHLKTELPLFETYCRHRRPLPEFAGLTAAQIKFDRSPVRLPDDFERHHQKRLPITAGFVHFIRFVSNTGTFSILNESWTLDKDRWAGSTIRATIDTHQQRLDVFHHSTDQDHCQLIKQFDYPLAAKAVPLDPAFAQDRPVIWPAVRSDDL